MALPHASTLILPTFTSGQFSTHPAGSCIAVTVIQQPVHGRMNYWERNEKRVLDPPLVVRISWLDAPQENDLTSQLDPSSLVVHVDLFLPPNSPGDEPESAACFLNPQLHRPAPAASSPWNGNSDHLPAAERPPRRRGRPSSTASSSSLSTSSSSQGSISNAPLDDVLQNLLGATSVEPRMLKGLEGDEDQEGLYGVWPDIGVRTDGRFVLRITLVDLASRIESGSSTAPTLGLVWTEPFEVFRPDDLPPPLETTALTRALAARKVKVATGRKAKERKSKGGGTGEEESAFGSVVREGEQVVGMASREDERGRRRVIS